MKKSNLTGWKDVFSFTLIQKLKSKAFIISNVILLMLILVSMPIITLISSSGTEDISGPSPVKKVYVNNETALPTMDFTELLMDETMSHIIFESIQDEYDIVSKRIEEEENSSVLLTITENEDMYFLNFIKASKGSVKDSNLQLLGAAVAKQFETFRINALGITAEQTTMLHSAVETKVSMADVSGVPIMKEDTSISNSQYWFVYGLLFIVLLVNVTASSQIATSIVTEKSTRVIEYLLISVRPMALMVGKILAMLTAVLLQIISMVVLVFISNKISSSISSGSGESALSQYLPNDIFQNLNLINIMFCILLILLGLIFYAGLAGLTGATVSRIEDMREGQMLFTFANMIGAYIGIGAANVLMGVGANGFVTFSYLFPLSSPFVLPGAILVGKASLPIIAGALVLQILFIFLLFKFVAKVFETLILHNGNTIKLKDLIKLSKTA